MTQQVEFSNIENNANEVKIMAPTDQQKRSSTVIPMAVEAVRELGGAAKTKAFEDRILGGDAEKYKYLTLRIVPSATSKDDYEVVVDSMGPSPKPKMLRTVATDPGPLVMGQYPKKYAKWERAKVKYEWMKRLKSQFQKFPEMENNPNSVGLEFEPEESKALGSQPSSAVEYLKGLKEPRYAVINADVNYCEGMTRQKLLFCLWRGEDMETGNEANANNDKLQLYKDMKQAVKLQLPDIFAEVPANELHALDDVW